MGRKRVYRSGVVVFACLALAVPVITAHALDLGLGVKASASLDVQAGFDAPTRQLIAGMPKQLREETLKLLKDALPLIDQSVIQYFDYVNKIIDGQIDKLACTMSGAAETMGAMFKHAIIGGRPRVVARLQKDWDSKATAFSASATPKQLKTDYADFLVNATVTSCRVATTPEASQQVASIQIDARRRWTVWSRLDGNCKDAEACFDAVNHEVNTLTTASDPRDLKSAEAIERYATVKRPDKPGFLSRFSQTPYEDQLLVLLSINDGVSLARIARESIARQLLASAKTKVDASAKSIADAKRLLSDRDIGSNERAKQQAAAGLKPGAEIVAELKESVAQMGALKTAADAETERFNAIATEGTDIIAAADKKQAAIRQRQLDEQIRRLNQFPRTIPH